VVEKDYALGWLLAGIGEHASAANSSPSPRLREEGRGEEHSAALPLSRIKAILMPLIFPTHS
jgi:hypothetical protein